MRLVRSHMPRFAGATLMLAAVMASPQASALDERPAIDRDVHAAVESIRSNSPSVLALSKKARGILVFPNIVKAGFLVGAQYGDGALIKPKPGGGYYVDEYFNIAAGSYGLQAGAQNFGYALLLMTDEAVAFVETNSGWELGVGPSIVVLDEGVAKNLTTTTNQAGIYAVTFGQHGLMAGMGLQGSKITRLSK